MKPHSKSSSCLPAIPPVAKQCLADTSRSKQSQSPTRSREGRWEVSANHAQYSKNPHALATDAETQVDAVDEQQEQEKADRGARTADNVRYGQNISEGGMGGKTTQGQGGANQGGYYLL